MWIATAFQQAPHKHAFVESRLRSRNANGPTFYIFIKMIQHQAGWSAIDPAAYAYAPLLRRNNFSRVAYNPLVANEPPVPPFENEWGSTNGEAAVNQARIREVFRRKPDSPALFDEYEYFTQGLSWWPFFEVQRWRDGYTENHFNQPELLSVWGELRQLMKVVGPFSGHVTRLRTGLTWVPYLFPGGLGGFYAAATEVTSRQYVNLAALEIIELEPDMPDASGPKVPWDGNDPGGEPVVPSTQEIRLLRLYADPRTSVE